MIYYNIDSQQLVDPENNPISDLPVIVYGDHSTWELQFYDSNGVKKDLSSILAGEAAIDSDWSANTPCMCVTLSDGVDLTAAVSGRISIKMDAETQRFLDVVNGNFSTNVYFQFKGFGSSGRRVFCIQFRVEARMDLNPGDTSNLPDPPENVVPVSAIDALMSSKQPEVQ